MSSYAPPAGPPPPRVPDGWKAVWNDQYQEWFYVNLSTKASQWDMPTEPAYAAPGDAPPSGAPPMYDHTQAQHTGPEKSNNPYMPGPAANTRQTSEDERIARQMQEEEDARATSRGNYGSSNYGASSNQGQLPPREDKKKGFLSKIGSKLSSSGSSSRPYSGGYGGGYGGHGGYPPQQYGTCTGIRRVASETARVST